MIQVDTLVLNYSKGARPGLLKFSKPPDTVFQAILRDTLGLAVDDIDTMLDIYQHDDLSLKADFDSSYPIMARVFTPRLALATLKLLRKCLDRPEIYDLNDYHYLLLYETLESFVDIHNSAVAVSRTKKERRENSFIEPFYIEFIDFDYILDGFFFDIDFLTPAETMLNLPHEVKQSLGCNPEVFAITQGMMPHPEELALKPAPVEDPGKYKISRSMHFGPGSKVYPDYNYLKRHISK